MRNGDDERSAVVAAALAGLAAAGLFGMASLYPLATGGGEWFYSSITAHITLAVHLWIPAAEIAVWETSASVLGVKIRPAPGTRVGLVLGGLLMIAGAFTGWDKPLPIDYAPMFKTPLFTTGMGIVYLAWLAGSITPLRAWAAFRKNSPESAPPVVLAGFMAASIAAWATVVNIALAFLTMPKSVSPAYAFQTVFYGPGHSIQFAHVMLMTTTWAVMAGFRDSGRRRAVLANFYSVTAGFVLWTPLIYLFEDPVSQTMGMAWTLSLGMVLGTITLLIGVTVLAGMDRSAGAAPLVLLSMLCFLIGGAAPSLDDRESLALTAHYHGLLIGASASYLGFLIGRRLGSTRPAVVFGLGGVVLALSFAKLTETRLLRKTSAMEGVWEGHEGVIVMLAVGSVLAATGVAWQVVSYGLAARRNRA